MPWRSKDSYLYSHLLLQTRGTEYFNKVVATRNTLYDNTFLLKHSHFQHIFGSIISMKQDQENEEAETSWFLSILLICVYMIPYGIINHLPLHREVIPFVFGEEKIPFLPWTFIIYVSVYIQGLLVIKRIPNSTLKKILPVATGMVFLALLLFIFFPIEYPRSLYTSSNPFVVLLRITDGPGNCFPSLHVAITVFLAFCYGLIEKSPKKKVVMWLWSVLICISVLTTKQHYLVDILGGVALTLPGMYFLTRHSSNK
jgi:membrane-associated phospholipid phosphatase